MAYYNGSDQYSDIEALLAKTEFEGESKDNKNLDNVDDWLTGDVNVQNEIWRGKKLCEKKPKADVMEKELIVPNINFFECFVKQPRVRKGHLETFKNNTSPSAPRSRCTCTRTTSAASSYLAINRVSRTTMQRKAKKGERCPMRIAELAVPTKRQCIETWRNKSDVLPEFMVDRLKQHVMDQRPIVKIPEAIYCFQNGRRVPSKNYSFRWLSSKHEPKETPMTSNHMDARMLSIVFAHKVAKILARPINLTINSEDHKTTASLEKLSAIVSSDITKIMSKCNATKGQQFKAIQSDVSNRITVWITGILEDLSFKLLEEDLRDLEDEEGPVLDFIDDLVDTVMNVCEPPQLHIDTDSNLSSSTKYVLLEEESQKLVETLESADDKMSKLEEIFNSETSSRALTEPTDDGNENLTDSEYFRNEISNIIDNIITKESGDDMSNGSGDDIENGSRNSKEISSKSEMEHNTNDENNEEMSPEAGIEHDVNDEILPETEKQQDLNDEILPEAGLEHDVNDENNDEILPEAEKEQDTKDDNNEGISSETAIEHDLNDEILPQTEKQQDLNDESLPEVEKQQDIKDENNVGISPEARIEHDTNDENFDQIDENASDVDQNDKASDNAAETHSNVSERFQIFPDDSDDDKNSKKVMFPKKDLVNPDNPADQINTSTAEEPTPEPVEHKRAQWNPQTIMFAEPNQNLLSDADESWPAELGDRPMLKVSESASKSVSSLGRITENDEKQMSSPEDEDSMTDKGTGDTVLQVNDIIEKLDNILVIEKHHTASEPSEPLITVYIETSSPEPGETQVDSKILYEKDMGETITILKPCHDKPVEESSKLEENQTDSGESELIRTGSTTDRTGDDETPSHKSQSQVDYGWKVQPKTAPSWVISWGQDRGEPSEDSIPIQIRPTKVSEIELRKWCKELEKAFTNLDMWSNWISATCKEGISVLQQKEWNCPALAQKAAINWMRLKRNVHKDALLWTKLFQRTDQNFTSLKKKYNNIEIVAAEYCALCKCDKTKSRYQSNNKYLGYRTKQKDKRNKFVKELHYA